MSNAEKIAKGLVDIGYEFISQPKSSSHFEIQCRWCRKGRQEDSITGDAHTIKQRVIHDDGCPVALAHIEIK